MGKFIRSIAVLLISLLLPAGVALAGTNESFRQINLLNGTKQLGNNAGFNTTRTIPEVVGTIVQWVLALVGIIALVFFIAGGFQYLTSQGNEEQVTAAKNRMIYAVVGLVIIAIAWVATAYVVGLFEAARANGFT